MSNDPRGPVTFTTFEFTESEDDGAPQEVEAVRFQLHQRHVSHDARQDFPNDPDNPAVFETGLLVSPVVDQPGLFAIEPYEVSAQAGSDYNQIWIWYKAMGSTEWILLNCFATPEDGGASPAFAFTGAAVKCSARVWQVDAPCMNISET